MKRHTRRAIALLLVLGTVIASVWLGWRDTTRPILRTVSVEMPGLKREYRILQVTDLHGSRFGPRQSGVASLVSGKRFDAVVMTGDMILSRGEATGPAMELARVLSATSDVVAFSRGNHDDERVGPALATAGVHDLDTVGPVRVDGLVLESADRPVPSAEPAALRIVATHSPPAPDTLAAATTASSTLTLVISGHTHGGQVRLPLLGGLICPPTDQTRGAFLLFPELRGVRVAGAYRDGRTASYISPGLGTGLTGFGLPSWVRFRLGVRSELTEIIVHGTTR